MRLRLLFPLSVIALTFPFAAHQQTQRITKQAIIRACKPGKRERKPAASYIVMIERFGVDFSPTTKDETDIRSACKYLGTKELNELIAAIHEQYKLQELLARVNAVLSPSPTPRSSPTPDWKASDEARRLAAEISKNVQDLIDEGNLIDLTDYRKALRQYLVWVEKASVTLGNIEIKMRRFPNAKTNYKKEFDDRTKNGRDTDPDQKEVSRFDKEILRNEIRIALIQLDWVKSQVEIDTRPDAELIRRPFLLRTAHIF